MKLALLVFVALLGLTMGEALNNYVSSAKEVQDLLQEGSDNCYLLLFVWKGETEVEEAEAKEVQDLFNEYPECYWANLDVARSDTKALLNIIQFENDRDNFSKGRQITREDTPLLLGIVNGHGWVASGPKPHLAMRKELDSLYRDHVKSEIEYED